MSDEKEKKVAHRCTQCGETTGRFIGRMCIKCFRYFVDPNAGKHDEDEEVEDDTDDETEDEVETPKKRKPRSLW